MSLGVVSTQKHLPLVSDCAVRSIDDWEQREGVEIRGSSIDSKLGPHGLYIVICYNFRN